MTINREKLMPISLLDKLYGNKRTLGFKAKNTKG